MSTTPWERTCQRCGKNFEVGLWCLEVTYCDTCKAELDAMPAESIDVNSGKPEDCRQVGNTSQTETKSDRQVKRKGKGPHRKY